MKCLACCCYIYCSPEEMYSKEEYEKFRAEQFNLILNNAIISKQENYDTPNAEQISKRATPMNEKPKRVSINQAKSTQIWRNIYPNSFEGICKLCSEGKVSMEDGGSWERSHVKAHAKGGDSSIENFRPLCRGCNRAMGKKSIQQYAKEKYPKRYKEILKDLKLDDDLQ